MFDEFWEIWVVCWHGGFLALLLLLLLPACCDCWPSLHHRRIHLDRAERNGIQALVEGRIQELKRLVKDVIIARLDDGSFRFSSTTRKSEEKLFAAVQSMMAGLGKSPGREQMIALQRSIKKELMSSPYDLRGSRRTFLMLTFIKKATETEYTPSCMSSLKKFFFTGKGDLTRPRRSTIVVSRMTLFQNMVLPIIFVGFDMSSDGSVIVTMARFIVSSESTTWIAIVFVSLFILIISTISLLLSDPMGTLMASVKTTESMNSPELEREDVPLSLGSLTQHDLVLEEARGESSYQMGIQWLFYLFVTANAVNKQNIFGVDDLDIFDLALSSSMCLLSLTMAQYKACGLASSYSSTTVQKGVYLIASLGSSVSTQLLLTFAFFTIGQLGGPFALSSSIVVIGVAKLFRKWSKASLLDGSEPLQRVQSIPGRSWLTRFFFGYSLTFSAFMEVFQLQSSKVKTVSVYTSDKRTTFLQKQHQDHLFKENLIAFISLEIVNLTIFLLHIGLPEDSWMSTPPVYSSSPALYRFLMVSSTLGPSGWVISQGCVLLYHYIDSGVLTCGINFNYNNPIGKKTTKLSSKTESNEIETADNGNTFDTEIKFNREVKFVSSTGSWVEPDDGDDTTYP